MSGKSRNPSKSCKACGAPVKANVRYCETADDAIRAWNTRADNFTAPRRGVPEAQKPPRQETGPSPANLEGTR